MGNNITKISDFCHSDLHLNSFCKIQFVDKKKKRPSTLDEYKKHRVGWVNNARSENCLTVMGSRLTHRRIRETAERPSL